MTQINVGDWVWWRGTRVEIVAVCPDVGDGQTHHLRYTGEPSWKVRAHPGCVGWGEKPAGIPDSTQQRNNTQ